MIEKVYVRYFGKLPNNENTAIAAVGFDRMGVQVVPFRDVEEIESFTDLGETAMVVGNIGDVWVALKKMGLSRPKELDYPDHLKQFMGRSIKTCTIEEIRRGSKRVFVKPVSQKLFTGLIFDPENPLSRLALAPFENDTPVIVSDVVDFVSEHRCFIKNHALVGVKHYKGDWALTPSASILGIMMSLGMSSKQMPDAYAIDLGVTSEGKTLLVEVNDGYALGCYGLPGVVYARFLETRWEQFVRNMQ